ncbi:MAG TPA: DUF2336 domain-containing protein [Alphaproteobacteria bacterium]
MLAIEKPEYLYRLARSGSQADRQELAFAMKDMLATPHRDIAREILLLLLREAELDLRQKLAEKLCTLKDCPYELIQFLVYENPAPIAEMVIKKSPLLQNEDLLKIAETFAQDPHYTHAIAQRPQLSPAVVTRLLAQKDHTVQLLLLNNDKIELSENCLTTLLNAAKQRPELQQPLLLRKEITPALAAQLYWHVSVELRQYIMKNFPMDAHKLDHTMEIVLQDKIDQDAGIFTITNEARAAAERLRATGALNVKNTVESLRKGNVVLFVCMAGLMINSSPESLLRSLVVNAKNEPLAALAHLLRLNATDFNSLYLLWRRHIAQQKMTYAHEVAEAFDCFTGMKRERLHYILNVWKK